MFKLRLVFFPGKLRAASTNDSTTMNAENVIWMVQKLWQLKNVATKSQEWQLKVKNGGLGA